jgi:hypothetical protein
MTGWISDTGIHKVVQAALSWLTAWRMIAAPIRRRILLISAPGHYPPGRPSY